MIEWGGNNPMKHTFIFFVLFIVIAAAIPATVIAATSQDVVYIGKDEVIDDNVMRVGNTITVDGKINGDLLAVGNIVTVNGDVAGDVIVVGSTIKVSGTVGGNIRAFGMTVDITGATARNVYAFGRDITLGNTASVGWNLVSGAQTATLQGTVKGNAAVYGGTIAVGGNVEKKFTGTLNDAGTLTFLPTAKVGGDLQYTGVQSATIQTGAALSGKTVHNVPSQSVTSAGGTLSASWVFAKLIGLFALLFVGVIVVSLGQRLLRRVLDTAHTKSGKTFLTGILVTLLTPLGALILLFTLIGIPFAAIALSLYAMLVYLSKIIVGTYLGEYLLNRMKPQKDAKQARALFWPMMLGTTIVYCIVNIPTVGWMLGFVAALWAIGAVVETVRSSSHQPHP